MQSTSTMVRAHVYIYLYMYACTCIHMTNTCVHVHRKFHSVKLHVGARRQGSIADLFVARVALFV